MFTKIVVHRVGNKINGESLILSQEELQLDEGTVEMLENYFLGSFKTEETYQFYSDSYLVNNPVFSSVSEIFDDKAKFLWEAENIAKHLFEAAENPRVQGGELFIVFFEDERESDERVDKIGIFKTEKRDSFLKIFPKNGSTLSEVEGFEIEKDQGISLSKIDKAALIYNNNKESGYVLSVVDNNKKGDMYYWFEDFLKVKQRDDEYFHTQEALMVYKDYIVKQLPQEFEVSKADQADFLNQSINFFKEKEEFKLDEFAAEVLKDEHVIESFNNFKTDYEQEMQINIAEEFPISEAAVKKTQRHFKSIIKLDKNFHIYIHGDRKMLEQGQDEKGKFYMLYFDKEV
ncbi:nucleoid-associated protein [Chryseobacterium sp. LC2016-27]|uniref:nucleoid-associated protein n=1 Tax=Chryseobacterium sp. LC2016-27 TaxID=2897326 RepID=UPI001E363323|nr:nucleoid-associated protein [Chryseobacterium sp. LC2016-27]MCD0456996.1 nucleoid-associated protein [Chryseobacterium sp. LC2016-27]